MQDCAATHEQSMWLLYTGVFMRGPTAFFLFSEQRREQARAECVAAAEDGAKVSVAVVAKAIGEKWRALTDAEKAEYQEKASQRGKELAESAAAAAEAEAGLPPFVASIPTGLSTDLGNPHCIAHW